MTDVLNYPASSFSSASAIDNVICDIQRTSSASMHESITYVEIGESTSMTTWAGVSTNNIALYNGLAKGNKDAVEAEGDAMDGCLTHASPNDNA